MGNKKNNDNPQGGSMGSKGMSDRDREFESQGKGLGSSGQGQQTGSGRRDPSSHGEKEDDEMTTAGGRKGPFSDSERDKQGQWSPGSTQASDQ